ncbi:MAG: hypothetical protein V3U67_07715 [Gemmatimonadota bacterium]
MEPISIVTAFVAGLYIVGRGPLLVAPAATRARLSRLHSTPRRIRILGCVLLVLVAAPLIVTARQAAAGQSDITIWLEGFGWFAAVMMVWVIAAPRRWHRFADSFWGAASHPTLRAIGALNVAVGLFLGWVAFVVL